MGDGLENGLEDIVCKTFGGYGLEYLDCMNGLVDVVSWFG